MNTSKKEIEFTGDSGAATATEIPRPIVCRNDYSSITVPAIGDWTPTLSVSILIPAHGHQDKLDLTLAALAAQTYPVGLTEVIVVDDNTDPPLRLPDIRPDNTTLVRPSPNGWGSANAINTAAARADGTVLMRLDSDMVCYHHHVESQLRYHHQLDYASVLGHKLFVDFDPAQHTPQHVHTTVTKRQTHTLYSGQVHEKQWTERVIDSTDQLRSADHTEAYRVFVGATGSVHRALFDAADGMDTVPLGGDSIFGYRLSQAGAVFIPDNDSSSWHLGRSQMQSRRDAGIRYRTPFVANRVPEFAPRRSAPGQLWEVPLAEVVVDVAGSSVNEAEGSVTALLRGTTPDIRVHLVADWPDPHERHATLDDPRADLRLIRETYRGDPRVRFDSAPPERDAAVPFRLTLPASARPKPQAIETLVTVANGHQVGLVSADLPEGGTVRLERHSAYARARHLDPGHPDALIDAVAGTHRVEASRVARRSGGAGPATPLRPGKSTLTRRVARRLLPTSVRRRLRRLVS